MTNPFDEKPVYRFGFGASGLGDELMAHYGITPAAIAEAVLGRLA